MLVLAANMPEETQRKSSRAWATAGRYRRATALQQTRSGRAGQRQEAWAGTGQLIRGQTGDHKRRGAGKSGAQSRERAASPIQPGLCGGRCQAQCCFQQVEASQLACA